MDPRDIARQVQAIAAQTKSRFPDVVNYTSGGTSERGLLKVRRPHWPEGLHQEIPSGDHPPAGMPKTVRFHRASRQFPWGGKLRFGIDRAGSVGGSPLVYGIWQQSEGFPELIGGPLARTNMPLFGADELFNPGFPTGYQNRIGWSGTALASSGADRYLLYLSTIYNDEAEIDPSEDAIGLTINEWDLVAGTLNEYTIAFPAPFDSDEGGSPGADWLPHRLGSFFYNPEDGLITIATPYGLYCMGREQDSQVLTPWSEDVARLSQDLSFSCAWFHGLQHGWIEQEGAEGPVLRGWKRERNSKDWVQAWTKSISDLCDTMTPGRIFQSGQTDRYEGYHQSNRRATYDPNTKRWILGITLAEDSSWVGPGGENLTGRAGIVINSLAAGTGAIVNRYTIEATTADAIEVRSSMLTEALAAANELQANRLADQKALVTSNDQAPQTQIGDWGPGGPGWPTKLISVVNYPGANPSAVYSFPALYNVTLSGATLPSGISGGVVPAPGPDPLELFPLFASTQGLVQLRKGDDGNFWTIVFRNRQIIKGYSFFYEAEIDVGYGSFPGEVLTYEVLSSGADLVGDGYVGGGDIQAQTMILTRQVPMLADVDHDVYETLLLCLSPSLVEISRTDLSLKFLQYDDSIAGPQTIPTPSWRNSYDWRVRGRVIFILRDLYWSDTEGETLAEPEKFKLYLQILSLETLEELHRIEVYADEETAYGGKLIAGIQSAGDLEWAEVACQVGGEFRLLMVQMQADPSDTPDTYRHTNSDTDFPASNEEWEHQVIFDGYSCWPSNFGAVFKTVSS